MKNTLLLALTLSLFGCKTSYERTRKAFIGTWHLSSTTINTLDKGMIMYSHDGQMTALLSRNDSLIIGYSGKYEINSKESIVTHFRDFYPLIPFPKGTPVPIFIRDYSFSENGQVLTLKPKETKGQELVWRKVSSR
jgi:hypothetical protein